MRYEFRDTEDNLVTVTMEPAPTSLGLRITLFGRNKKGRVAIKTTFDLTENDARGFSADMVSLLALDVYEGDEASIATGEPEDE